MKSIIPLISCLFLLSQSCGQPGQPDYQILQIINPEGKILAERILPPPGFERIAEGQETFTTYLRNLPLKPHGSLVRHYDGSEKANNGIYIAVVDMNPGSKDLMQCADAVIRLRADYLYHSNQKNKIAFNLTNGFRVDYRKWAEGYRVSVNGNTTTWYKKANPADNEQVFWAYLEFVFSYAGTLSLSKELVPVKISDMKPGDVFIQGGSPGHAIIVADMAVNTKTGEKVFLLAQSYMPAQEIQVLCNPENNKLSPWYSLSAIDDMLKTPQWTFSRADLKRFLDN